MIGVCFRPFASSPHPARIATSLTSTEVWVIEMLAGLVEEMFRASKSWSLAARPLNFSTQVARHPPFPPFRLAVLGDSAQTDSKHDQTTPMST